MVAKKEHKVTLYETSSCPWCKKTKEFLDSHNVKYKAVFVDDDQKAAQEMIEKSGQMGVPVVEIDGDIIVGFNKDALAKALDISA